MATTPKALNGKPGNGSSNPAEGTSTLYQYLASRKETIKEVAAGMLDPERVVKVVLLAARKSPKLFECDPASVFEAVLELVRLGMEPGGVMGQAALVPYGPQCQAQIMYQGLCELAYRSGLVKSVSANVVHVGDAFEWEEGSEPYIGHKPSREPGREGREWTHVYCVIETTNGGRLQQVMDKEAVYRIRSFSKTFSYKPKESPWGQHELRMACKTVVLRAMKLAPKSAEMRQAMALEGNDAIETTATAVSEARSPNDVLEEAAIRALGQGAPREHIEDARETVAAGPDADEIAAAREREAREAGLR